MDPVKGLRAAAILQRRRGRLGCHSQKRDVRQAAILLGAADIGMASGEPDLFEHLLVALLFRRRAAPWLSHPQLLAGKPTSIASAW